MDLRSIINNEAGENSRSKQDVPVTPIQAHPQQGFRDYSRPPQASPSTHPSHDYGASDPTKNRASYTTPSPSQDHRPFANRPPPPPPLQAPSQNDLRSPAGPFSAQSPYRQPSSAVMNNQYPFPQHQAPQNPSQHQQYPPNYHQRESYPQSNPPPPHLQTNMSQIQSSMAPQTPPIGMPGAPHPYLQQQQRSQSAASTPTSAHSQTQYFNQHPQESPLSGGPFPPSQNPPHQRQASQQSQPGTQPNTQPGTPLGTPIIQKQSSGGFVQPTSPYQQRGLSAGPFSQFRTSPAPPSATTPKLPSTPGGFDTQVTPTSDQQRRSQSERERSISVSPKTRPPPQAVDNATHHPQPDDQTNSVKRKMDDRDAPIEQPQRIGQPETKPQVNGNRRTPSGSISSPKQPPRKRTRYREPPIWALSVIGRTKPGMGPVKVSQKVNGNPPPAKLPPQPAPVPVKAETNGHNPVPLPAGPIEDPSRILGPWEKSITGKKPFEHMTKIVADWLYVNVVSRDDLGELASRGVEVEIEAKLGQLIDKDTSQRYMLPVLSECVLADNGRIGFKSSMTEVQHRSLNDFLNQRVTDAHPQNPGAQRRVPIDYLHRRETDKFYELPPSHHSSLPPAVRERLNPRHAVKVRVTYSQDPKEPKTVLAKIIKARIADIDIYNPQFPLDCRISINFEMRYDGDVEELKAISIDNRIPDRNKDRLSYKQSHYQVDLTQVTQVTSVNGVNRTDKEHELEIEISTTAIREQGRRAATGEPNEYVSLVEGFLDNMRVLARAVPPQ